MVEPVEVPRVVPGDADDDQVIAGAVTAHADPVISGDADLLSLAIFEGIAIEPGDKRHTFGVVVPDLRRDRTLPARAASRAGASVSCRRLRRATPAAPRRTLGES